MTRPQEAAVSPTTDGDTSNRGSNLIIWRRIFTRLKALLPSRARSADVLVSPTGPTGRSGTASTVGGANHAHRSRVAI